MTLLLYTAPAQFYFMLVDPAVPLGAVRPCARVPVPAAGAAGGPDRTFLLLHDVLLPLLLRLVSDLHQMGWVGVPKYWMTDRHQKPKKQTRDRAQKDLGRKQVARGKNRAGTYENLRVDCRSEFILAEKICEDLRAEEDRANRKALLRTRRGEAQAA